jgi:Flp pilus assembly protein CpaB
MRSHHKYYILALVAGIAFALIKIVPIFLFPTDTKNDIPPATIPTNVGTITLLTPERPVKAGERLAGIKFKELYWPRNQVPEGAVTDVAEVQGKFAKIALSPQVPLQRGNMTTDASEAILPMTPGNRAATVEVEDRLGSEAQVLPGSTVDVLLTYYDNGSMTSKIIVEAARVIGSRSNSSVGTAGSHALRSVTLDVSVRDALEIQTSRQLGVLSLVKTKGEKG